MLCVFYWKVGFLEYLIEVYVYEVEYGIVFWWWNDDVWYKWWMKHRLVETIFILENGFNKVNGFKIYVK